MKPNKQRAAMLLAVLAAAFYGLNVPFSKQLLTHIQPTCMAGLLYLGAGIGIGILYAFRYRREDRSLRLNRRDMPGTIAMIALDIAAPIFLMAGIRIGTAANASLLGNFEIVATTLIALLFFRERVSCKLWAAIALITAASVLLSFEGEGSFRFSLGSLFVVLATVCWGFENNCTRKISGKSTYQIVLLKGIFSGGGALIISRLIGEELPAAGYALAAMLLGFVSYGLSIFVYVRAQNGIGAAKTSAFYAIAPFIGGGLSFLIHGETFTRGFAIALPVMILGTAFVVLDVTENDRKGR